MNSQPQKRNRPIHEIRLGSVVAAIWANVADSGRTYHTVTPYRVFKTDEGEWRRTTSFDRDDLPLLVKVSDQAHDYIFNLAAAPAAPATGNGQEPAESRQPPPPTQAGQNRGRNDRRANPAPG